MSSETTPPANENQPMLMICLGWFVVFGCVTLSASILIADFVVPDHDWIADTISDLGAGRYEFIVDVGLYAYSAAVLCAALLAAHVHMGGKGWSIGILGLLVFGLLVFLNTVTRTATAGSFTGISSTRSAQLSRSSRSRWPRACNAQTIAMRIHCAGWACSG